MIHTRLGHIAAEWFGGHRRSWLCRQLGEASYFLWRAYENRNLNMHTNGEEWLLREFHKYKPLQCAFDVGANVGDWLALCRQHHPTALIHSFEIAPPTFAKLSQNASGYANVTLNSCGLSDADGEIEVFLDDTADYLTSVYPEVFAPEFAAFKRSAKGRSIKAIKAKVVRGDTYCQQHNIQSIGILKIDVEGMEKSVLGGFSEMFRTKSIQLVQFEYNTTNIASKFLLRDAYQLFSEFGYAVGKLYPNYVEFRDYHYRHEDFCGLNMIAVPRESVELQKLLSK